MVNSKLCDGYRICRIARGEKSLSSIKIPVTLYDKTQSYIELHSIEDTKVILTFWILGEGVPFNVSISQDHTISLPLIPNPIIIKSYLKGGSE